MYIIDEEGYSKEMKATIRFPHCDARVLHSPKDNCVYCNNSGLQEVRKVWGISFTGRPEPGKEVCPAEKDRGLDSINSWGGNLAITPEIQKAQDEYYNNLHAKILENLNKLKEIKDFISEEKKQEIEEHMAAVGRLVELD